MEVREQKEMDNTIDFPCSETFLGYFAEIGLIPSYHPRISREEKKIIDAVFDYEIASEVGIKVSCRFDTAQDYEKFINYLNRLRNEISRLYKLEDKYKRLEANYDNLKRDYEDIKSYGKRTSNSR